MIIVQRFYPYIICQVGTDPIGIFDFAPAFIVNGCGAIDIKAVGKNYGFGGRINMKGFIMVDQFFDKGNGVTGILPGLP